MAYKPLTKEQYEGAVKAGFSPDQIIANEKKRKERETGVHGIAGFGLGIAKGIGHTISSASTLGQKGLDFITKPISEAVTGKPYIPTPTANQVFGEALKPKSTAEKVGFTTEQIGEFFIPGTAATKVGKAAEGAKFLAKAPSIVKGGAKLASTALAEAGVSGGMTALQGGNKEDVKTAAMIGGAFPVAGKVIKGFGTAAKESAKYMSSVFSGVPVSALEHAFANPNAVKNAISKAVTGGGVETASKIGDDAISALNTLKTARGKAYEASLAQAQKDSAKLVNKLSLKGLKQAADDTISQFGGKTIIDDEGRLLINAKEMAIDKAHVSKLQEVMDRVYDWSDKSPIGLNKLRRIIDGYKLGGVNLGSSEKQFNAIIGKMRTNLDKYVREKVPTIGKMNDEFSAASDVIDNIVTELKVGRGDPNTALRKLLNVFNPKSEVYRPVVQELGEKAGKDLMSDIAGLTLSKWTPEGLGKYLSGLGIIGGFTMGPKTLLAAPLASPRIVGEGTVFLGKTAKSKGAQIIKKTTQKAAPIIKGAVIQSSRE